MVLRPENAALWHGFTFIWFPGIEAHPAWSMSRKHDFSLSQFSITCENIQTKISNKFLKFLRFLNFLGSLLHSYRHYSLNSLCFDITHFFRKISCGFVDRNLSKNISPGVLFCWLCDFFVLWLRWTNPGAVVLLSRTDLLSVAELDVVALAFFSWTSWHRGAIHWYPLQGRLHCIAMTAVRTWI